MTLSDASILVVDDEPMLLGIFVRWLLAVGCRRVFKAADGKAALAIFEHESIDLLLTDVRMPVMDGITLVRRLADLGKTLPSIVFVSGFGDVDRREMYALGVEAFIAKPFDRGELLGILEKAVAERSTLWQTEMTVAPRQSLLIEAKRMDESASKDTIGVGRGGFTICSEESISPGKVAFHILLAEPGIEIAGQGYIRWCSRIDCKAGIELVFVDVDSRAALTKAIASASPRSFIPGS